MDLQQCIISQTEVSLSLTKHIIAAHGGDKNLVISPLSIHVILSLLTAGSNGPTKDQLLRFLKSNSPSQLNSLFAELVSQVLADGSQFGGPQLSSANGVWVEQSFPVKPPFRQIVENGYQAVIKNVDFRKKFEEVRVEVNTWAEKQTKGLIKEILPPGSVNNTSSLILANAIYFKGFWKDTFYESATRHREFFLMDGSSIQAPFMFSSKMRCVRAFDCFKVLRLPYKQGQDARKFSMYIYLPDAKDGLQSLIEKISSESGFIDRHLPSQYVEVDRFRIPKFKIGFGFKAKEVLEKIGLGLVFYARVCGLGEMVEHRDGVYVSEIYHKAFIEVNEEGTEAAAVTAAALCLGCSRFKEEKVKVDFVADHPFLFLIREDTTGVVLFVGQVLNPLQHNE